MGLSLFPGSLNQARADEEWFTEKVSPILQQRCFSCHNDQHSEGDLSLQSAQWVSESGYVEPGDPQASYLMELIQSVDGNAPQMPKDAQPLSDQEVEVLRQWIQKGAHWPTDYRIPEPVVSDFDWWSLRPLQEVAIPQVADKAWQSHPIDAFIQARREQAGVPHSPRAEPAHLIRRLSYDLTGLPPDQEDVERFTADPSQENYEAFVDHYLDSPRYGERWGRHWLDLVRYADTCGYDKDKPRPNAWPYRDYVIRSFNQDKPYDQFVKEQLAGDQFYPDSADGIVGLGFIAAGPWDFIGHVEVPESKRDGMEARNLDRDEMVSATMNVFCSTTVQCARCHNHKFDPITQQHYYNLQAVFAGVDRAERTYESDPQVAAQRKKWTSLKRQTQTELDALARTSLGDNAKRYQELEAEILSLVKDLKPVDLAPEYGYHSQITAHAGDSRWIELQWDHPVQIRQVQMFPCYDSFADIGAGFGFPRQWNLQVWGEAGTARTVASGHHLERRQPLPLMVTMEDPLPVTRLRLSAQELIPRSGDFHLALAEIEVLDEKGNNIANQARLSSQDSIEAPPRWRLNNLVDGIYPHYADQSLEPLRDLLKQAQAIEDQSLAVKAFAQQRQKLQQVLNNCDTELAKLPALNHVYAAATEFSANGNFKPTHGTPRKVHYLNRGQVSQPGELAVPGSIPLSETDNAIWNLAEPQDEGQRRAAMAQWILDPQHPLTWRSAVNRIWLHHFGQGLVATPNDFGRMGIPPTHPELLDWLATDFRQHQSFKKLHRLIVTSQTYQQSCDDHAEASQSDQDNRWYWRMNRRRLSAEEIRDSILLATGHLDLTMGGPGYYLFELDKPEHSPHYEYHLFDPADPTTHRRTVYRFVVRSQPDPLMVTFDCADSSQSVPQRDQTLTALQALSLMNNRFVLLMSDYFADHLRQQSQSLPEQIQLGFRQVTGRLPEPEELKALQAYSQQHGLQNTCRVLFNLNEFVFVE